jgi:hypothetical protein
VEDLARVVDDFEWGGPIDTFYEEDTSSFEIVGSNNIEGDFFLKAKTNNIVISRDAGDDSNQYDPQKGDIIEFYTKRDSNGQPNFGVGFDRNNSNLNDDNYNLQISFRDSRLRLDGPFGRSATGVNYNNGLYRGVIEWHDGSGSRSDNTIVGRVFDVNSVREKGTELASVDAVDSNFQNNRGIVIGEAGSSGVSTPIDLIRRIGTVDNGTVYD